MNYSGDDKFQVIFPAPEIKANKESKEIIYTVKSGDTLGKIAAKLLGSSTKYMFIATLNQIKDPNIINIGQKLKIKTGDDTLTQISYYVISSDQDGNSAKSPKKKTIL